MTFAVENLERERLRAAQRGLAVDAGEEADGVRTLAWIKATT